MDYIFIDGINELFTRVIIDGVETTPVTGVIYVIESSYLQYKFNGTILEPYSEPEFVPYDPKATFSRLTNDVVITLDNTRGTYNDFLPHGFIVSNRVMTIDCNNGFKVERKYETDGAGFEHTLFDITIDRTNKPTVISYI